jgi:hypothetical protein
MEKFPLTLVKHHAMKTYGWWKYSFSITDNINVSGQLHVLAASTIIILIIVITGKKALFESQASLEDSARFVHSVVN